MGRILVIRGGAIGDFILTLPALGLLRTGFAGAHIEVMSYERVLPLVERRHYADAVRSIEYGPLAACFNPRAKMDDTLRDLFLGCGQIISFLYDPDRLFQSSLEGIGVKHFLPISPILGPTGHASAQLAAPLSSLALFLEDPQARLFPSEDDHAQAERLAQGLARRFFAIHPGSGSPQKNWSAGHWIAVITALLREWGQGSVLIIAGEADAEAAQVIEAHFGAEVRIARHQPLNHLAALLARAGGFLGHDSGISHLAAAVGTPCLLLFGPTDHRVWAPAGSHVKILTATNRSLDHLSPSDVLKTLDGMAL